MEGTQQARPHLVNLMPHACTLYHADGVTLNTVIPSYDALRIQESKAKQVDEFTHWEYRTSHETTVTEGTTIAGQVGADAGGHLFLTAPRLPIPIYKASNFKLPIDRMSKAYVCYEKLKEQARKDSLDSFGVIVSLPTALVLREDPNIPPNLFILTPWTTTEGTVRDATTGAILGVKGLCRHFPKPALPGVMSAWDRT